MWLLRDLPALIGIVLSFWPLMIMVIANGRRAMSGRKISPRADECVMHMLPIAEAQLHYALCRQAWRALGWNVRDVQLEILPPIKNWSDLGARFEAYTADMMDLHAAAARFTEGLRRIYRIRASVDANAVRAAHASTDAALSAAAQHELVGAAATSCQSSLIALMLSSARSARPSKHERGLTTARGPPKSYCLLPIPYYPESVSFRERARMPRTKKAAPSRSGLLNSNPSNLDQVVPPPGGSAIGSCACFTAPSKIAFGSIASEAWKMSPRTLAPEQS